MEMLPRVAALAAAGLIVSSLAGASPSSTAVREVHKTVPLGSSGRLEISTFKGSVTVAVWDRPEAEIAAKIEADGDDSDGARSVERTEVRITGRGDTVRVESDYDRVHHLFAFFEATRLPFVHYTIRMPATARLEIEDHKSDTKISGLRSDLKVSTHKGTVQIDRHEGAMDVRTHKGEIHAAFARFSHASRFQTYKGTVEVSVPKDSRFDLEADGGRRGEVDSDFAVASTRRSRRGGESMHGSVNGGGPTLSFESSRGTFRLKGV